jgi:hypothetical protein
MIIVLTNTNPEVKGDPIALNTDFIVSIREGKVKRDGGVEEQATLVFCPPHGTWEVEESLKDILKMINKKTN